jgi:hypothetical protein
MSKKKKEIHVDKLVIKANKVFIIDEDNRRGQRGNSDPWFGFLRGDRREREFDDIRDEFKKDDDVLDDVEDKFDQDFEDDKKDKFDDVEDRRRPWWF